MIFFFRLVFFFVFCTASQAGSLLHNLHYGIAASQQTIEYESVVDGNILTGSESALGANLFAEKYYRNKYRFTGNLGLASYEGSRVINTTVSAEYIYPLHRRFALVGGLSLGAAVQQYNGSSFSNAAVGAVYGGQLGGILFINKHLTINLGYRLNATNLETQVTDSGSVISTKSIDEAYLGFLLSL